MKLFKVIFDFFINPYASAIAEVDNEINYLNRCVKYKRIPYQ